MISELITVVVPVYNVEAYLDRCVESLVNQTYQNLEIILVDDGSPDRSPEICDRWAEKDERIKVIHKPNGGVSSARNAGMEAAAGEWVFFVDSDDFLPEDALEGLAQRQLETGADLVCGSFHNMKTRNRSYYKTYAEKLLLRQDFPNQMWFLMMELLPTSCGKLFSTRIVKEHGLAFPMNIPWGEDAIFHYRYLTHVSSVVTTAQCVYHYDMTREGSAVKKYYENLNQLAAYQYGIQKELLQSIEGNHAEIMKGLERSFFVDCLPNYVFNESNRKKLAQKIQELASTFPESANHEVYGEAVRQQNWLKVARLWKQQNIKWYVKEMLNRAFGLHL